MGEGEEAMESDCPLYGALESFFRREAGRWGIEAAFLVGSHAALTARPDSDVDVALLFSGETDLRVLFDRTNEIAVELARISRARIDMIVLDPDLSRPMLAYNCIVRGIPLYLRDPARLAALRNEAIRQMEDFRIFGVAWQIEAARRNLEIPSRA